MKAQIPSTKEVEIKYVSITVPVRYDEEDMPNDFPMRHGESWSATVEVDTGKIVGWPKGKSGSFNMKVVDGGEYELQDADGQRIVNRQDYVPHGLIPGEYGDYIDLKINEDGVITNWPKSPDVSAFFRSEE